MAGEGAGGLKFPAVSGRGGSIRRSGVEDLGPANLLSILGNWGMTQGSSESTDGARCEVRNSSPSLDACAQRTKGHCCRKRDLFVMWGVGWR